MKRLGVFVDFTFSTGNQITTSQFELTGVPSLEKNLMPSPSATGKAWRTNSNGRPLVSLVLYQTLALGK
jgi:hypothetical protein